MHMCCNAQTSISLINLSVILPNAAPHNYGQGLIDTYCVKTTKTTVWEEDPHLRPRPLDSRTARRRLGEISPSRPTTYELPPMLSYRRQDDRSNSSTVPSGPAAKSRDAPSFWRFAPALGATSDPAPSGTVRSEDGGVFATLAKTGCLA